MLQDKGGKGRFQVKEKRKDKKAGQIARTCTKRGHVSATSYSLSESIRDTPRGGCRVRFQHPNSLPSASETDINGEDLQPNTPGVNRSVLKGWASRGGVTRPLDCHVNHIRPRSKGHPTAFQTNILSISSPSRGPDLAGVTSHHVGVRGRLQILNAFIGARP